MITDDSPEPMVTMFVVEGGLIYLDKPEHGGFAAYEDGFTLLELCRNTTAMPALTRVSSICWFAEKPIAEAARFNRLPSSDLTRGPIQWCSGRTTNADD